VSHSAGAAGGGVAGAAGGGVAGGVGRRLFSSAKGCEVDEGGVTDDRTLRKAG
jgi:hypothetical protein